jgi:hypothetical protein
MNALVNSLTRSEQALLRETDRDQLGQLDEDGLMQVHGRIRRARDKHVNQYRRQGAVRVRGVGGRGKARAQNSRNAGRAEVFEDALARVSRYLAAAARASAAGLKAERIAQGRQGRNTGPGRTTAPGRTASAGRGAANRTAASRTNAAGRTAAGRSTAGRTATISSPNPATSPNTAGRRGVAARRAAQGESPDLTRRHATTRATNARRQARRDSR